MRAPGPPRPASAVSADGAKTERSQGLRAASISSDACRPAARTQDSATCDGRHVCNGERTLSAGVARRPTRPGCAPASTAASTASSTPASRSAPKAASKHAGKHKVGAAAVALDVRRQRAANAAEERLMRAQEGSCDR
eukprot:3396329-Pleurochrysis_carterae.AAC.1